MFGRSLIRIQHIANHITLSVSHCSKPPSNCNPSIRKSSSQTLQLKSLVSSMATSFSVVPIPVLSDNFSYLLINHAEKVAAAVDPAEPQYVPFIFKSIEKYRKVIAAAKEHEVNVIAVLTTHHHWDHAGGNNGMVEAFGKSLKVYGGDSRVEAITETVKQDDIIQIGHGLEVKVHFTPCHTSGHVLYEVTDSVNRALFTGDTLFIAGCGRFFEGTADQMYHALMEVVANMPHETKIYCGHEYTVKNLEFGLTVEPQNEAIKTKLEWAKQQRSEKQWTIPSTVGEELKHNVFMRVNHPTVAKAAGFSDQFNPVDVMAKIRKMKDNF